MAVEKRREIIWNGVAWVEHYHPTSDDIVYVEGGTKTLRTKLGEIETEISDHATSVTLHITSGEKSKLANLDNNANATYETKADAATHADDVTLHKTSSDRTKLTNLAVDANATYATKSEIAGQKGDYYFATIQDRNESLLVLKAGDTCWVGDASADTTNIEGVGSGRYTWDGDVWQFLFEADANIKVSYEELLDAPTSTASEIDAAISKAHTHANASVLNGLGVDQDGDLTLNSAKVGEQYNRVYLGDEEPEDPNPGDIWMAPIEEP